jgi:hypothetical protein
MADEIIVHPTYMAHVRHFFDEIDLDHMNGQGVGVPSPAVVQPTAAGRIRKDAASLNTLAPFTETADMTINLTTTDVAYAAPAVPPLDPPDVQAAAFGSSSPRGTCGSRKHPRSR